VSKPVIIVFTRDLRIRDNPALVEAVATKRPLCALFVFDDAIIENKNLSSNRMGFLIDSLKDLEMSLNKFGLDLIFRRGNWVEEVTKLAKEINAEHIHMSADFSLVAKKRQEALSKAGDLNGFKVFQHQGVSVLEPGFVTPTDGSEYKIFTPYYRRWSTATWRKPLGVPESIKSIPIEKNGIEIFEELKRKNFSPDLLKGGESEGIVRLKDWMAKELNDYEKGRDDIGADRTSRLSPYLHLGCISPLEVALQALKLGGDAFVRQLCWRDFYLQILDQRPDVSHNDYRDRKYKWNQDFEALNLWKEGQTGFPIVDAGMRQLLSEGFMHNRVRMVVASFLTKDLHIDWRHGAGHFMNYLVDGDIASNQLNWQWVAGTGTDSNPNRIFNPTRQSEKFDKDGNYIRRWVLELKDVDSKEIHEPNSEIRLEKKYPKPIVDHHEAISIYKSKYSGSR
tara:strand:+ start:9708 stop:11060 length:1353 start_codon:yes stop_codon:yes gene_type:complete